MERQHLFLAIGAFVFLPILAQGCILPFEKVGTQCLLVDALTKGSFYDMRLHCSLLGQGGKLAKIPDANQLNAIIKYIQDSHLDHSNYWVDAEDGDYEGTWRWSDGTLVPKGSPFWRYECDGTFSERPTINPDFNCAILDLESHYRMADTSCLGDVGEIPYSPICEQV